MSETYSRGGITVSQQGPMQIIKFDNVKTKNAISIEAYTVIKNALNEATEDNSIVMTVLTGVGSYYSSGFNITGSVNSTGENTIRKHVDLLRYLY